MSGIQLFAFVVLPILIVAIALMGVLSLDRSLRRSREAERLHPGE